MDGVREWLACSIRGGGRSSTAVSPGRRHQKLRAVLYAALVALVAFALVGFAGLGLGKAGVALAGEDEPTADTVIVEPTDTATTPVDETVTTPTTPTDTTLSSEEEIQVQTEEEIQTLELDESAIVAAGVYDDQLSSSRTITLYASSAVNNDYLSGAQFSVTDVDEACQGSEAPVTYQSDGTAQVTLSYGHTYEIQEVAAPEGFSKTDETITATVSSYGSLSYTYSDNSFNNPWWGYSLSAYVYNYPLVDVYLEEFADLLYGWRSDEASATAAIAGAQFQVEDETTGESWTVTTEKDVDGLDYRASAMAHLSLPWGHTVKITSLGSDYTDAPSGDLATVEFVVDDSLDDLSASELSAFDIFIHDPNNSGHLSYYIAAWNTQSYVPTTLVKTSMVDTSLRLANAVFDLYDDTGRITTVTTGSDGTVFVGNLSSSFSYRFDEVTPPAGYQRIESYTFGWSRDGKLLSESSDVLPKAVSMAMEPWTMEMQMDTERGIFTAVITAADTPYASMTILKVATSDSVPLEGAVFELYDITDPEAPWELVDTVTTGAGGTVRLENLEWEHYYALREIQAPDGYALIDTIYQFMVSGRDGSIWEYSNMKSANGSWKQISDTSILLVTDKQGALGSADILKVSASDGSALAGATFALYDVTSGSVLAPIWTGTTGADGYTSISGLKWGHTYEVREIEAPDGYACSGESLRFTVSSLSGLYNIERMQSISTRYESEVATYRNLLEDQDAHYNNLPTTNAISLDYDDELDDGIALMSEEGSTSSSDGLIRVTQKTYKVVTSGPKATTLTPVASSASWTVFYGTSYDSTTDTQTPMYTFRLADEPASAAVIQKVDAETGDPIDGVSFSLYEDESLVKTVTTADGGLAKLGGLEWGHSYTLREAAPEGYEANADLAIEVAADGTVSIVATDGYELLLSEDGVYRIVVSNEKTPEPDEPTPTDEPTTPEEPTVPEDPTTPEEPTTPTTPEEPVTPEEPTAPAAPEEPATPAVPDEPAADEPAPEVVVPVTPATTDEPAAPSTGKTYLTSSTQTVYYQSLPKTADETSSALPLAAAGVAALGLAAGTVLYLRRRAA